MKFFELSDAVKDRLRDQRREWNVEGLEWWEFVYEDAITTAACLGITTTKAGISFSGFWSQGDGASFTGGYSNKPDAVDAIKTHAPLDEELQSLAQRLTVLQMRTKLKHGDQLMADISRSGRGCHEFTMEVNVYTPPSESSTRPDDACELDPHEEQELTDILRSFARWIYGRLEEEYNYLTSDESIDQTFDGEEFDEEGEPLCPRQSRICASSSSASRPIAESLPSALTSQ